jgi:cytochrome c oxidase subunit 2
MLDGSGVRGVYPSLAGDPIVRLPRAELTLDVVLSGRRAMPGFGGQLPVQQLAAVVTYIRRSWGNRASAVSAADVK